MAHIIIDGYNLTGTAHDNLDAVRSDLIRSLQTYSKKKGHDVTVVFDGWKDGRAAETKTKLANITVIYTRLGDTADRVIKNMISSSSISWIVISSDREVYDYAEKNDHSAVSSGEFEHKLYSALGHSQDSSFPDNRHSDDEMMLYEEEYEDDLPARHKGNPRKMSKREKIKLQALKKL